MIAALVILGLLAFIVLVLYVINWPAADERQRIEREAHDAVFRINENARAAFGQMLEAARRDRQDPA